MGGWSRVHRVGVAGVGGGDEGIDVAFLRVVDLRRRATSEEQEEESEADRDDGDPAHYTTGDRTSF